jgi:hypothetical protein
MLFLAFSPQPFLPRPLSLRMMSRPDFRSAPSDWAVVSGAQDLEVGFGIGIDVELCTGNMAETILAMRRDATPSDCGPSGTPENENIPHL